METTSCTVYIVFKTSSTVKLDMIKIMGWLYIKLNNICYLYIND